MNAKQETIYNILMYESDLLIKSIVGEAIKATDHAPGLSHSRIKCVQSTTHYMPFILKWTAPTIMKNVQVSGFSNIPINLYRYYYLYFKYYCYCCDGGPSLVFLYIYISLHTNRQIHTSAEVYLYMWGIP